MMQRRTELRTVTLERNRLMLENTKLKEQLKNYGEKKLSYENLKRELTTAVQEHYQGGTPINDIRAALHAADLMAEKIGAIEILEVAKSMSSKNDG